MKRKLMGSFLFLIFSVAFIQAASYTLAVDAGQQGAAWNRFYEKCVASCHANIILNSAWGRNIQNAMQKGNAEAGFKYIRMHGILDSDVGVYNEDNGIYNWTNFDKIYDAVKAAGMRPVLEISFTPPGLASDATKTLHWYNNQPANKSVPKDWTKWQALMKAMVLHCEERYGVDEVRNNWYFEVWNEPDWMYDGGMTAYVTLYNNTVTGLLQADPNIKVGGPAQSGPSTDYSVQYFLPYCRDNNLKVDFISYHRYADDNANPSGTMANATAMMEFQQNIITLTGSMGFTGELLLDEWGPTFTTDLCRDTEISASFIAKTIHLIGTNANYRAPDMFAYWTLSDIYEEFDTGTNTAYNEGNYGLLLKGDSRYPDSFDLAKPAFNAFKLLHKMGATRLTLTGGTVSDGVNGAATIAADNKSIQILVYNHVNGTGGNASAGDSVTISVSNIPFAPGSVKIEHFVIDNTRSNSHTTWVGMGRPSQPSASQWAQLKTASELVYQDTVTTTALSGKTWSKTFTQNVYSVGLIVLTAAGSTPVSKGDVNGDGSITIVDALMTAQYSVGLSPQGFTSAAADVNCSGAIDIVDALIIAQRYVGLISAFSC